MSIRQVRGMAKSRLRTARQEAGLTLESLADDVLISVSQLSRAERGERWLRTDEVMRIADRLGVAPGDLLGFGSADFRSNVFPVLGFCGLGESVEMISDGPPDGLSQIELPFGFSVPNCAALICRGHSMAPRIRDGDVVIYHRDGHTAETLVGREAIVGTSDGRVLLKIIEQGNKPYLWNLVSHNFPTLQSISVEWTGEIIAIIPLGRWKTVVTN